MPFDLMSRRLALHELVLRDDRSIRRPHVGPVHVHVPFGQVMDHLRSARLVPSSTLPVEQLSRVAIERFPAPECTPLCLERMPHLIAFQDNRSPRRLWLLLGSLGKGPDPVGDDLRGAPEEERDAVHGQTTEIPQDGVDLHRTWLLTRGRAGTLIATLPALLLRFARRRAVVDDAVTLTCGVRMHQGSPPPGVALPSTRGISQSCDANTTTTCGNLSVYGPAWAKNPIQPSRCLVTAVNRSSVLCKKTGLSLYTPHPDFLA